MNIGEVIKKERLQKGMSQSFVAKELDISQDTVSLWELNKRIPMIDDIVKLANLFNISIEEMIGIEKDSNDKYIL